MPEAHDNHQDSFKDYKRKVWIAAGIIALTIIVFLLFKALFSVILLTIAGILMAIYFHGCAGLLQKIGVTSKLSVLLSVLLNVILLAGFFWFVGARLQQQVSQLSDRLPKTIQHAKEWMEQNPAGSKVLQFIRSSGDSGKTTSMVKRFFSSSFGILSDVYIIILMGLFFTASPFLYKKGIIHLLPPKAKDKGEKLLESIHKVLKDWLKGQLFGFMFIAVLTGIGLWIVGLPLVLTLALIAGLLNFIPNFGPIIALIPAMLIALMQGTTTALIVVGFYTFIQVIQSAVTQPLIQRKMVNIPPALIIFGQVAMGLLGGFWGVLLATPVIAILMTVVNKLYVEKQSHHKYEVENSRS